MFTRRTWAILLICGLFIVPLLGQAAQSAVTVSAAKKSLKKREKGNVVLSFKTDVPEWKLACEGVQITGWTSPMAVRTGERTPSGDYSSISGQQFKAGTEVKVDIKRLPETKKGETGQCRLTSMVEQNQQTETFEVAFR